MVEDEHKLSTLLRNAIGENFANFYVAYDGEEGLEIFREKHPDIVITDIMMPKKDGLSMAKEIRADESAIPIIILSAFSETEKLLGAIDVGVIKYFIKPFDPDELLQYIVSLQKYFGQNKVRLRDGYSYDTVKRGLYKKSRYVALSQKEKEFLELLVSYAQQEIYTVKDSVIKEHLWGEDVSNDRLRTFIRRFRVKTSKELVKNIKSEGYQVVVC